MALSITTRTLVALFMVLCGSAPVYAQSVIRDAEIESDLWAISTPILKAAGLNPGQVRLVLLNDNTVNAFVAGGQNIFVHSGLILDAKNVGELGGVIAHEAGHIAGGHLVRMRGHMERASVESIIATLAGIALGVGSGDANAGVATALGGSEFANRRLLRNSRTYESSADQAALTIVASLGYTTQPMADFLGRLAGQEALSELQRSPYVLTHPLSRERLNTVQAFADRHATTAKPWPSAWEEKFQRMQVKILAFTQPAQAETRYKTDNSFAGRYAVAIAAYRQGRIPEALKILEALQKQEPQNPYLVELRGQILFEQGRISEAVTAYRQAAKMAPQAGLIHLGLAQALLQQQNGPVTEAITHLNLARQNGERDTSQVYRWLAVAYGRQGKEGLAKLNLAEEALLKRDLSFAIQQATRAQALLPSGTERQRAEDIMNTAQRLQRQKKD